MTTKETARNWHGCFSFAGTVQRGQLCGAFSERLSRLSHVHWRLWKDCVFVARFCGVCGSFGFCTFCNMCVYIRYIFYIYIYIYYMYTIYVLFDFWLDFVLILWLVLAVFPRAQLYLYLICSEFRLYHKQQHHHYHDPRPTVVILAIGALVVIPVLVLGPPRPPEIILINITVTWSSPTSL